MLHTILRDTQKPPYVSHVFLLPLADDTVDFGLFSTTSAHGKPTSTATAATATTSTTTGTQKEVAMGGVAGGVGGEVAMWDPLVSSGMAERR